MARQYMLRVRLTEQEKERLQSEANRRNVSMSEVIQDYCKRLPKTEKPN
ncbi:MAG: ribbon-helix-helix protein, CopG family [Coleofasciculus sp. Co-bin14]|nr:ribbon-helix-helix protein, CopG family [Coleofasciculus sp. Co-bin14]